MRIPFRRVAAMACVTASLWLTAPAHAQVPVVFGGESWDGPTNRLQAILDGLYGAGAINVETDYIGHQAKDLDPWFWVDHTFRAFLVREVAGNANHNVLGWYEEIGQLPVIDGVNDGVVFDGPSGSGAVSLITFSHPMTKFGFYLDPNGASGIPYAPQPEKFWTNRRFNDRGPDGSGAIHRPSDGDVQALVFDISNVVQIPNTWLVCFEDLDSGLDPSACCSTTDNDFNDVIFEVQAFGATPVLPLTFGQLKQIYR